MERRAASSIRRPQRYRSESDEETTTKARKPTKSTGSTNGKRKRGSISGLDAAQEDGLSTKDTTTSDSPQQQQSESQSADVNTAATAPTSDESLKTKKKTTTTPSKKTKKSNENGDVHHAVKNNEEVCLIMRMFDRSLGSDRLIVKNETC